MISEGILAIAASSISAFAITVFPEPVEPSIAACLARTCGGISIGFALSLRLPRNMPLGLKSWFEVDVSVITESLEKMSPTIRAREPLFSSTPVGDSSPTGDPSPDTINCPKLVRGLQTCVGFCEYCSFI